MPIVYYQKEKLRIYNCIDRNKIDRNLTMEVEDLYIGERNRRRHK